MDQLSLQISKKAACGRTGKRPVIGNQFRKAKRLVEICLFEPRRDLCPWDQPLPASWLMTRLAEMAVVGHFTFLLELTLGGSLNSPGHVGGLVRVKKPQRL